MSISGLCINWVRICAVGVCCAGLLVLSGLGAAPCSAGLGPSGALEDSVKDTAAVSASDSAGTVASQGDGDLWEDSIMLPEIVARLQKILPESWEVSRVQHKQAPRKWAGAADGILIRLENPSVITYNPNGFEYHPFFRIWLCPTLWRGSMEEVRFGQESDWPVLLGQNHKMKVFYLSQGFNDWTDGAALLRQALNLTSLPITRSLREKIDPEMMMKIFPKLALTGDAQPGLRDRVVGLEKEGPLAYVEYATATIPSGQRAGQVSLSRCQEPAVVWVIERENQALANLILRAYPEVQTVYLRRVCDEYASDRIINRADDSSKQEVKLSDSAE